MHELPQLGKLERKYPNELAVIGVQSPKYLAEGDPENVRKAVQRLGVEHPVVNDPDSKVWEAYSVSAWPTLVFISPGGQVIGRHAGEAGFDALDSVIAQLIAETTRSGELEVGPLPYTVEPFSRPLDQLSFPGKVLPAGDSVFIADSGHHRVLMADTAGTVKQIFGTGEPGFEDGNSATARFYRPQGMAIARETLYVADSENHAIRAIDLAGGRVSTVAGTGRQARRAVRSGPALQTDLSSPWDLALDADSLFIAMAGLHQIWVLDNSTQQVSVWAGTGHEAIRDGPREQAWLAQPMGLCLTGRALYVSCAESQAIRRIDLDSGAMSTIVGRGLFDFGDLDGPAAEATLQHNQGVAADGGTVYVADTYNNKIKKIDTGASSVSTWLGSGETGLLDGPGEFARLDEPGGVVLDTGSLWIADSNNHVIRRAGLSSGHVDTFDISGCGLSVRGT